MESKECKVPDQLNETMHEVWFQTNLMESKEYRVPDQLNETMHEVGL